MTIAEFYKKVDTSVAVAKIVFNYLSEHYTVKRIGQITETSSGGTPTRGNPEFYNGNIPWLKSGELNDGLITTCEEYITNKGLKGSSAKLFPKGTLLVAMYGATAGKVGVLDFDASTNQAVCAIFPNASVQRDYLFWYFRQQRYDFIEISRGGAQPNISQTVINNAVVPVPDAAVQKQVVDFLSVLEKEQRIDSGLILNEEVAQNIARYFKIRTEAIEIENVYVQQQTHLTQLRQAILQEAVQGKLTAHWRQENQTLNGSQPETGADLLARIRAEKADLIRQGKLRKEKPLPPITDAEKPFELPKEWVWCRLGEIVQLITKGSSPNWQGIKYVEKPSEGILFITSKNVGNYELITKELEYVETRFNEIEPRSILMKGDLLTNIVGASIGRSALYDRNEVANINQAVCLIRLGSKMINTYYALHLLNSSFGTELMFENQFAPGRANLSMGNIANFPFPLPPLGEQQTIVAQVEQLLGQVSALETENKQQQSEVGRLMQAVLREAFAGKRDEPISAE